MEAVRKTIDGNVLNRVLPLPKSFRNRKVEVIVFPVSAPSVATKMTRAGMDEMMKGSVTESLIGIVPDSGRSLEDYREERLSGYSIPSSPPVRAGGAETGL